LNVEAEARCIIVEGVYLARGSTFNRKVNGNESFKRERWRNKEIVSLVTASIETGDKT